MRHVELQSSASRREIAALENATATEIIEWALARFGKRLCVTTSFTDTVLIHLATTVEPDMTVVFLDTGFHFPETLATMRESMIRYQLRLRVARPESTRPGPVTNLWADGTTPCCDARKVRPLDNAMANGGFDAWLSGLRRTDSITGRDARIVGIDRNGRTKINPIANWDDETVAQYIADHDLVVNPLADQGYDSVGCWPCTEPGAARTGRWTDETKTECGLHTAGVEVSTSVPAFSISALPSMKRVGQR